MKRSLSGCGLAVLLLCGAFTAGAQIPNAGFETWSGGSPANWFANNVAPLAAYPVTQSGTAHGGSSAVRGETIMLVTGAPYPPTLQSGAVTAQGFAYTQRAASITGYYQFTPVGGDRISIVAAFYKGGINGTGIAMAAAAMPTAASSYTKFTVPFAYTTGDVPDWAVINISIIGPVNGQPHTGSVFLIDDFAYEGTATAIGESGSPSPAAFGLKQNYPNPFNPSTTFQFSVPAKAYVLLTVTDALGRDRATVVSEELAAGTYSRQWNAAGLPSGLYFYTLRAGSLVESKKLLLTK